MGNITTGGTGKTPAVIYLANLLKSQGKKVAVLSRGYGRKSTGTQLVTDGHSGPEEWETYGDEPTLMAHSLEGIPIVVDEDRYRGGTFLVQRFNPDVIILDDAFQHRSLIRDVDIVLVNSQDLRADHKLLPYGILREPWIHLRRAHLMFFTKTNLKRPSAFLRSRARASKIPFYSSRMDAGQNLVDLNGSVLSLTKSEGKKVLALSAVGDPDGFLSTLAGSGLVVADSLTFMDHYVYNQGDVQVLRRQFEKSGAEIIVTTEKDLIKLQQLDLNNLPIYALSIRFAPDKKGERALLKLIET